MPGGGLKNMPAELGPKPWTLDYTPNLLGTPDLPQKQIPGVGLSYPSGLWDPALIAGIAATEFAAASSVWQPLNSVLTSAELDWQTSQAFITQEIEYLLALMADDRDRYMPEILAQAEGAPLFWLQLLNLGGGEKPATNALISFAQRAGEMAALYFKMHYKRVRPSALCAGLLVPFGPPRHPAFPSGHALTGHLTTYLLLQITSLNTKLVDELTWLAGRVAKNRERAGIHYPSDSVAGQKLAEAITGKLTTTGAGGINSKTFNDILAAAKLEWP
jgi:membrane-associated phospholipid phosphatase